MLKSGFLLTEGAAENDWKERFARSPSRISRVLMEKIRSLTEKGISEIVSSRQCVVIDCAKIFDL